MERQFTATIYIFYEGRVLLHLHPKIGKYLPPGGHLELNETPPEAALREAEEETGLKVAITPQENVWVESPNAASFERPYLCLLEEIPAHKDQPPHQHIDFVYIGKPVGLPSENIRDFQWFGYEDLKMIEEQLFLDTKKVLELFWKTEVLL